MFVIVIAPAFPLFALLAPLTTFFRSNNNSVSFLRAWYQR
jgi:hypothetical protein